MVIAIIVLGLLLGGAVAAIIKLSLNTLKTIERMFHYLNNNYDDEMTIDEYFEIQTGEKYPCTLMMMIDEFSDFIGTSYDFSYYDSHGIIALTQHQRSSDGKPPGEGKYENVFISLQDQTVCLMKDGGYQWDIRSFL